ERQAASESELLFDLAVVGVGGVRRQRRKIRLRQRKLLLDVRRATKRFASRKDQRRHNQLSDEGSHGTSYGNVLKYGTLNFIMSASAQHAAAVSANGPKRGFCVTYCFTSIWPTDTRSISRMACRIVASFAAA